jgi:hypothetical protein
VSAVRGEIAASLCDGAGRPQVRLGVDNELTLRVTNRSGRDLVGPSLALSLAPLFADPLEQARSAVAAPPGWRARFASRLAAWELQGPALPHGATVEARFAHVRPDVPVGVPLLRLAAGDAAVTLALHVLPGPSPLPALWERVEAGLCSPGAPETCELAVTDRPDAPVRGDLVLTLANRSTDPLVRRRWGPWPPTFTLVVPTAEHPPGHGALTTPRMLDDAELTIERGRGWRVVKRRPGPEWDIVATAGGGRRDGLAENERLELRLRRLTTGFAPGPAVVELRSYGFPGYADGVQRFTVLKRARR